MPATAEIDGIKCTIDKQPDGTIRVQYSTPAVNALHGPGTGGMMMYVVHPCQRHQFEQLNALLPPGEQAIPPIQQPDQRPWWSLSAGERANLRE